MLKSLRLNIVLSFARMAGVPIEVHHSFFAFGKKLCKTSSCPMGPK